MIKVHAIRKACELIISSKEDGNILIYCDSQSALLALENNFIQSRTVYECVQLLNELGKDREIVLRWVRAHVGHLGNEIADELAKRGTQEIEEGPEPFLPVPDSFHKDCVRKALAKEWSKKWNERKDCRQTKIWFPEVHRRRSEDILRWDRQTLGKLIQFFTGHNFLRRHEALQNNSSSATCRLCGEDDETSWHLAAKCPAVWRARQDTLYGVEFNNFIPDWSVHQIIRFLRVPTIADLFQPNGVE